MGEPEKQGVSVAGMAGSTSISRRSFLKATAAAGASAALGTATLAVSQSATAAEAGSREEVFMTACRSNCQCGCPVDVHVRDGKVVRTSGHSFPEDQWNRICPKGLTLLQRTYSKERVQYPMKRVGERGADQWERISWDQAIEEVAGIIKKVQAESGYSSFVCMNNGSGDYAICSGTNTPSYSDRFQNATNCICLIEDVDRGMIPMYPHCMGLGGGYSQSVWVEDWPKASTILLWGSNIFQSDIQVSKFLLDAQENGCKLICIDPQYSVSAAKCDMHIPIRPGSDGLLVMGLMKVMLEKGWADMRSIKKRTTAGHLMFADDLHFVRAADLGMTIEGNPIMAQDSATGEFVPADSVQDPVIESDGLEFNGVKMRTSWDIILENLSVYTMDDIVEKTALPLETIEELADIYANNGPAIIQLRFGFNHYMNATYTYTAMEMLPAFAGHYDKPYGGMSSFLNSAVVNFAAVVPPNREAPEVFDLYHPTYPPVIPFNKGADLWENQSWNGERVVPRVFYVHCSDFVSNLSDRNHILEWINSMETLIVADCFMTDTARYADYVLPASFWLEQEDMFLNNYQSHPYAMYCEKAIEPLFESKPDFEIYNLILKALGLGDTVVETQKEWFEMALDTDGNREIGLTAERLMEEKLVKNYFPAREFTQPQGQLCLVCEPEVLFPKWYDGQEFDPVPQQQLTWTPPAEAWYENELYGKYPFNCISQRSRYRTHTQWWDVKLLHELECEPYLKINPQDAAEYGIEDNDYVRIFNDRGSFTCRAQYHTGIQPGTLYVPRGWQEHQMKGGHHSSLSHHMLEPWVINETFYDVLVGIEKA